MERAAAGEGRSIREKAAPFLRREAARRLRPRVEKFFKERDGGGGKKREKRGEGLRVQFLSGGGSQREKNGGKKEKKRKRHEMRRGRVGVCVIHEWPQRHRKDFYRSRERLSDACSLSLSRGTFVSRRLEELQSTRSAVIIPLFLDWWTLYSAVFPGTKTSRSPYSRIHCRLSDAIPFFLATSGRPALLYSYCT